MNGAIPLAAKKASRPKTINKSRMGSSHHFLFSARKCKNSRTRPIGLASLALSKSVLVGIMVVLLECALNRL